MQLDEATDTLLGAKNDFHFFVPLEKSSSKDEEGQRLVQGIASTDHNDLQDEKVVQKGIDYAYFLRHGYINNDHKDGPENKVGEPLEAEIRPDGFWIKAFLYKGKTIADEWWSHIQALERSGSKRRVGFSIQGKVLRRDGRVISKCWLQDVAITASPVNTNTWAEVCKSLSMQQWCLEHPDDPMCTLPVVGKDEKKALTAGGMGRVVTPQSLEGRAKVQTYKSNSHRITYPEAVSEIARKGYSISTAKAFADAIFTLNGNR